jgi:predicted HTH domain antitoxin
MGKANDKSSAARELMEYGWTFALLEQYRTGKLSLGRLAEELDLSVSETMDLLAAHGVHSTLSEDDFLTGLEHLRKVAKGKGRAA